MAGLPLLPLLPHVVSFIQYLIPPPPTNYNHDNTRDAVSHPVYSPPGIGSSDTSRACKRHVAERPPTTWGSRTSRPSRT